MDDWRDVLDDMKTIVVKYRYLIFGLVAFILVMAFVFIALPTMKKFGIGQPSQAKLAETMFPVETMALQATPDLSGHLETPYPAPSVASPVVPAAGGGGCTLDQSWGSVVLAWCADIMDEAAKQAKFGVTPEMLASIIFFHQENGETGANKLGGIGLMAIMSSDYQCSKFKCYPNRPSYIDLQDGSKNIDWGGPILAQCLKDNNGNFEKTLFCWYGSDRQIADRVFDIFSQHQTQ